MPELPEVETSRRGIQPHIEGQRLTCIEIRNPNLRWPVDIPQMESLVGQSLLNVGRRAKYLKLAFESGTALLHLGMSGSLRVVTAETDVTKHDHVDFTFDNGTILRFNDPRRFGALVWAGQEPEQHTLLASLGPEPFAEEFNTDYCYKLSRNKKTSIKQFIMDGRVVVGVGNIYANESLFMAGIHPARAAGRISRKRYERLVSAIKTVIGEAINQGGTTLQDFTQPDGKPGYFKQSLSVYGLAGEPCTKCEQILKEIRQNNRSTVFCSHCQT